MKKQIPHKMDRKMRFCSYFCFSAISIFVLPSCITSPGPSVSQNLHDLPAKTFRLKRDLPVSRSLDSYREGKHALACLYSRGENIPNVVPAGTRFQFDHLQEEYDCRFGIFPFFVGFGHMNVKYAVWLKFPDYQVSNSFSGKNETLHLKYVWGCSGEIFVAPWESGDVPKRKSKRDLIRWIETNPEYSDLHE